MEWAYCRAVVNCFNGHSEPSTLLVDESHEIGLVYENEDPHWEPIIQSFCPGYLENVDVSPTIFSDEPVEKIRSVYLHKQCGDDTYSFHDFIRFKKAAPFEYPSYPYNALRTLK